MTGRGMMDRSARMPLRFDGKLVRLVAEEVGFEPTVGF